MRISLLLLFFSSISATTINLQSHVAEKIFDRALELGQAQGKSCLMSFASEKIMQKAAQEHQVSKRSLIRYIKSDSGKKHLGRSMLKCMRRQKAKSGNWKEESEKKNYWARVSATDSNMKHASAVFEVRCLASKITTRFFTRTLLPASTTIKTSIQLDNQPALAKILKVSKNPEVMGTFVNLRSKEFLDEISNVKILKMRFLDRFEKEHSVTFELKGISKVKATVLSTCKQ